MKRRETKMQTRARRAAAFIGASIVALFLTVFPVSHANAQCTALTSHVCKSETSYPKNYSINQANNYWAVIGVIPTQPDDKDISLYSQCASGIMLATSQGVNGTDFIVGDFNHNPTGMYYPATGYGDPSAYYDVYWSGGGTILPVSVSVNGSVGGSGAGCNMIQIYDVLLEEGAEYKISLDPAMGLHHHAALFRNPSAEPYWAGRQWSELEMTASEPAYYVAPATDWYGLVVFLLWTESTPQPYRITVEKLGDCIPIEPNVCFNNKLYSTASGPANDYLFTQEIGYWAAVTVLPDTLDEKVFSMFTGCDQTGTYLAATCGSAVGDASFMVGDFNHNAFGDYYPWVYGGSYSADFTIQWDSGADIFPVPGEIIGTMSGSTGECKAIQIWDAYLEAGTQYEFYFYQWGQKAPHVALFRNPAASEYWMGMGGAEFEMTGSGYHNYMAPQNDYYGLVIFADERKPHTSLYQLQVQPLNDCYALTSMICEEREAWPRDFSFSQSVAYWSVVGVCPHDEDYKRINLWTQCDGKGTLLAESPAYGGASFIVGDFNHNAIGTYYAQVSLNDGDYFYTVQADNDAEILSFDTMVEGTAGGVGDECGFLKIRDVFLEGGKTYQIGFTRSGTADMRLALFRNPGGGTYWAGRTAAVFEQAESGNQYYTAPASDWYGVVVFANRRDKPGCYTLRISEYGATGIDAEPILPERFALYQNVPNPFNPSTRIAYDVPGGGGHVTLTIYDVNGRTVRTLVDGEATPGERSAVWDGRDDRGNTVSTGVYFYRLVAPVHVETRKMVLMK